MEIANNALHYVSWPLTVLIISWCYRKPIAALLRNVRFLRTGNLELQFSEQLRTQGFTDLQLQAIAILSEGDIDLFLLVSYSDAPEFRYEIPADPSTFGDSLTKLERAGLMSITTSVDEKTHKHVTTPAGRRVRALLVHSTAELLREGS